MPATEHEERRREARQRVLKTGRIMIDKKSVISCVVRSSSVNGCRLHVDSVVGVPDEFELEISGGPPRKARIAWRTATEIGVTLE